MKTAILAALSALGLAASASAQDGFYYGIGLGVTKGETVSTAIEGFIPKGTDYSLALTAGYRFTTAGSFSLGIEGNLDALTGNTMVDSTGREACDNASPTWCEVDTVARLRGVVSTELGNGNRISASIGEAMAWGRGEQSNSVFKSTDGRGLSVGLSWEGPLAGLPLRIDVNYDKIRHDNLEVYDQTLDLVGLRASYMF